MHVSIVGAGAIGCCFATALCRAGHEVHLVDPWLEHVQAINHRGGLIQVADGCESLIPLRAYACAAATGCPQLIILAGKAMDTAALMRSTAHLLCEDTVVVTFQNGLGVVEAILDLVLAQRVVVGTTLLAARLLGPGRVREQWSGVTSVAPWDETTAAAIARVRKVFEGSGMKVRTAPDGRALLWQKVAFNSVLNTLCALNRTRVGALADSPDLPRVARAVVKEASVVARLEDVPIDPDAVWETIRAATSEARAGSHLTSMLYDLSNGRPTEIDYLNGAIARRAAAAGIAAPWNEALTQLVKLAEHVESSGMLPEESQHG